MLKILKKLKSKKFILASVLAVAGIALLTTGLFVSKDFLAQKIASIKVQPEKPLVAVLAASATNFSIIAPQEKAPEAPVASKAETQVKKTETKTEAVATPAPAVKDPPAPGGTFQWGATMRPNAVGYSAKNWQEQIDKAKELGLGWARMNFDYASGFPRNDLFFEPVFASGLKIVLVVEHNPAKGTGRMYQDGLDDGKSIASHYKGKISYYQLANEGGAQAIKSGTLEGWRTSDYDPAEYARVRDYIKGLSEGIKLADPGAQRIVTISWMHTGFLDKLVADGVQFDMVGVDWYSWMGNFGSRTIGTGQTLYSKVKSFGKPIVFAEVNAWPRGSVDETAQANFIRSTAAWAWNNRNYIKGFYVYELVDNATASGDYKNFGIVSGEVGEIGDPRPAFNALKEIIN